MLCVSTTPGTRSAAAATRSFAASPCTIGSTCTVTWAGPIRRSHGVLDPVHRLVAALQALQPRHADDDVGEALAAGLADPHRAHLGHSRHPAGGRLDQAAEPARGAVHQHVHVVRGHPRGRHQHQCRHDQRGDGVGARIAGGRRSTSPTITAVVPAKSERKVQRAGQQRGVSLAAAEPQRGAGARRIDRPARRPAARTRTSAPRTAPPPERSRSTASTPIQQATSGQEHRLGQRGQVLGLAVAVLVLGVGGTLGDADRIQREQRGRGVEAGVHGLGQDAQAGRGQADRDLGRRQPERGQQRDQRGASSG